MIVGVTILLLGLTINSVTQQTFSAYLREQSSAHSSMLPVMLAGHYTQNRTWDGAQPLVETAAALIGAQVMLADAQGRIVAASDPGLMGPGAARAEPAGPGLPIAGPGGEQAGTVFIGRTSHQQHADKAFLAAVSRGLVGAGLGVSVVAAFIGWLMARSVSRPLAEMHRAAGRIAQGDYGVRVSEQGRDEVAALGQAFNHMAAGMAGVEELRRRLVADVSHELRTPLTVLRGYVEGLRSGLIADRLSAERAFEAMQREVSGLLSLVEDLRHISVLDAGPPTLNRQSTTAHELVTAALARMAPVADGKGVTLRPDLPADLPPLFVDPDRMGQVLFNLVENAVRHTQPGGQVTISAADEGGQVRLTVADDGEGIGPEHLPHLFERFYRGDPARTHQRGGGAGLGLAIVKAIVLAHGGQVSAQSSPGEGSAFSVHLPPAPGAAGGTDSHT